MSNNMNLNNNKTSTSNSSLNLESDQKQKKFDEADLCKICMESLIDCVLLDCGHMVRKYFYISRTLLYLD